MSNLRQKLIKKFREKRYRQVYVDSFLDTYISTQIKTLRQARKLSQGKLGKMIGTTQGGVSAFESTDYSSWSIRTLRKLAAAFDVALIVRFESFGKVLDDITSYSRDSLLRPSFEDDPSFKEERLGDIKALQQGAFALTLVSDIRSGGVPLPYPTRVSGVAPYSHSKRPTPRVDIAKSVINYVPSIYNVGELPNERPN